MVQPDRTEVHTGSNPNGDPIKIALILSGAVALGSFEAGVVHELLAAASSGAPITIDVIAGSSAGSLVGAMAAKSLVTGAPYRHMLPRWTEVTLDLLTRSYESAEQALRRGKPRDTGILSTNAVREVLQQYLVRDPIGRSFQPTYASDRIVLLMTLTNLDGLPGTLAEGDDVRFSEAVTFTFRVPEPRNLGRSSLPPAIWERVALAGMASSAFPGAFDPEYLAWPQRLQVPGLVSEEWENDELLAALHQMDPRIQPRMRYCDGGILDEQPLERAIGSLVRMVGSQGQNGPETLVYDPRRLCLLIEPDPPVTTLEAVRAGVRSTWFSTFNRAIRLWGLSSMPRTSHWRIHNANARMIKLVCFLADLAERMQAEPAQTTDAAMEAAHAFVAVNGVGESAGAPGLVPPEIFAPSIVSFYDWLEDDERFRADMAWLERQHPERFGAPHQEVREAVIRLRSAYLALHGIDPAEPRRYQEVLAQVHLTLAQSLGLTQPWVLMHTITPDDPRAMLRGEEAIHFGGFFAREFLEHDYEVGRYYARLWLRDIAPNWEPADPVVEPEPSEEGISWSLLWRNRGPLWRMGERLAQAILEGGGLQLGGAGRLLIKVISWSFLLWGIHALLVTGALLCGWVELPSAAHRGRLWLLLASSLFPLLVGIMIGVVIRNASVPLSLRWLNKLEGRRLLNIFLGKERR